MTVLQSAAQNYTSFFLVVELDVLRGEWSRVRDLCWSVNTHKARVSQWRRFDAFCEEFNLDPLPASVDTVGLHITYLSRSCCYTTIKNYISGVWALHDYSGVPHVDSTSFLLKSTMLGAKRLLGCETVQATPLSPEDMCNLFKVLDMSKFSDLQFWCAVTLSYRCLLRVSHITESPHVLRRGDIIFTDSGMDIIIRSSKTVQFRERLQVIPIIKAGSSVLCPCEFLALYLCRSNLGPDETLFPYNYNSFAAVFKRNCKAAGLTGQFTTHSMRCGSASFLSTFLPLHDVKTYGNWKSWSVLLYISDTYTSRKSKDHLVADRLSRY